MVNDSDVFSIRPGFTFWPKDRQGIYYDRAKVSVGSLTDSAVAILEQIDGRTSVSTIVKNCYEKINAESVSYKQFHKDVTSFLAHALKETFIIEGPLSSHLKEYWGSSNLSAGFGFKVPQFLQWEVTTSCNLRCCFCYDSCEADARRDDELTLEQGQELIKQFSQQGLRALTFSGGEPLLVFDKLKAWIKTSTECGIASSLFTNGNDLSLEHAQLLKEAGLESCRISLHSSEENVHDRLVNKRGAWSKAIAGIKNMVAADIACSMSTTVGPYNIEKLRKSLELAINLGCNGFIAGALMGVGRGEDCQSLRLSPLQNARLLRFLSESSLAHGKDIRIGWEENSDIIDEGIPSFPVLVDEKDWFNWYMRFAKNSACGIGVRSLGMASNGQFTACPFLGEEYLGSAMKVSLQEVWQNKRLAIFRQTSLDEFDECGSCNLRYSCYGGCRACAYHETGSLTGCHLSLKKALECLLITDTDVIPSFYSADELADKLKPARVDSKAKLGVETEGHGGWVPRSSSAWFFESTK